jgi:hypothetical protein
LARFAVETKLARFAIICDDRYPAVPRPITVDPSCVWRYEVDTRVAKLAVETRVAKLAVETKLARFAVETRFPRFTAVTLDKYPTVPKPITVLVRLAVVSAPIIFVA